MRSVRVSITEQKPIIELLSARGEPAEGHSKEEPERLSLGHWSMHAVASNSLTPWTVVCQAFCPWDFSGKNIGVGWHFLLQQITYEPWKTDRTCIRPSLSLPLTSPVAFHLQSPGWLPAPPAPALVRPGALPCPLRLPSSDTPGVTRAHTSAPGWRGWWWFQGRSQRTHKRIPPAF